MDAVRIKDKMIGKKSKHVLFVKTGESIVMTIYLQHIFADPRCISQATFKEKTKANYDNLSRKRVGIGPSVYNRSFTPKASVSLREDSHSLMIPKCLYFLKREHDDKQIAAKEGIKNLLWILKFNLN